MERERERYVHLMKQKGMSYRSNAIANKSNILNIIKLRIVVIFSCIFSKTKKKFFYYFPLIL